MHWTRYALDKMFSRATEVAEEHLQDLGDAAQSGNAGKSMDLALNTHAIRTLTEVYAQAVSFLYSS